MQHMHVLYCSALMQISQYQRASSTRELIGTLLLTKTIQLSVLKLSWGSVSFNIFSPQGYDEHLTIFVWLCTITVFGMPYYYRTLTLFPHGIDVSYCSCVVRLYTDLCRLHLLHKISSLTALPLILNSLCGAPVLVGSSDLRLHPNLYLRHQ